MKPTKEHIFRIICAMADKNMYWDNIECEDEYEVIGLIITEWEKIRSEK